MSAKAIAGRARYKRSAKIIRGKQKSKRNFNVKRTYIDSTDVTATGSWVERKWRLFAASSPQGMLFQPGKRASNLSRQQ
jgi:hypothetical protein